MKSRAGPLGGGTRIGMSVTGKTTITGAGFIAVGRKMLCFIWR